MTSLSAIFLPSKSWRYCAILFLIMDQTEEVKFCESNCANGSHKKFYISYDQGLSSYMGIRGLRKMSTASWHFRSEKFGEKNLLRPNLDWKSSDGKQQKGINCDARLLLVVTPILYRIFGLSTSSPAPKWALRSEKCGWDDNRCRNKWMSWDWAGFTTLTCSTSTNKPKGFLNWTVSAISVN